MDNMMINISVKFLGHFERAAGKSETRLTLKKGATVADAVASVAGMLDPKMRRFLDGALISLNGSVADKKNKLTSGDRLVFMSPVIGGG